MNSKSIASVMIFAGSLLCFFLPFVTVSCAGQKVFTLSGEQMAIGTSIEQPQPFGPPTSQRIDPNLLVTLAALCALVGVSLSIAGRRLAMATAVSGAVGTVSLAVMASRIESQIQKATNGVGQANLEFGYTLTLVLLIAATAWNLYLLLIVQKAQGEMLPSSSQAAPSIEPHAVVHRTCANCGQELDLSAIFCDECGTKAN